MLRYCSLFSGSSGNSTYVGTADAGILIDAGVSAKRITEALRQRELDPTAIKAVLVTHEHSDHVAGLRVLCKQYGWPVLASQGTLDALYEGNKLPTTQRLFVLTPGQTVGIYGMQVTPFSTPHDSRECIGFRIEGEGQALALATDIGYMTDEIRCALTGCQLVHIESNHDPEMLRNGPYPYYLQERILGKGGHLSNDACAAVLPELLEGGATRLVLAHLSRQNNTPELARKTAQRALAAVGATVGRDCLLEVAEPEGTRPLTYF